MDRPEFTEAMRIWKMDMKEVCNVPHFVDVHQTRVCVQHDDMRGVALAKATALT